MTWFGSGCSTVQVSQYCVSMNWLEGRTWTIQSGVGDKDDDFLQSHSETDTWQPLAARHHMKSWHVLPLLIITMYLIIIMSLIITLSLIIIMFLIITSSQYFSKMSNSQSLQLILVLFSSSSNIGNFLIKHCNLSASDLHSGKLRGLRWTLILLLIISTDPSTFCKN